MKLSEIIIKNMPKIKLPNQEIKDIKWEEIPQPTDRLDVLEEKIEVLEKKIEELEDNNGL